ncbi:MAG: AMP-binding protein, partial [Deltaproteobacteria bacterium]|nr:AMP-binding protein [Deltaproteobacteria bacterium]
DKRLTYLEFNRQVSKVANGLIRLGIKKGDKVGVYMLNSIEALQTIYGVVKAGGTVVPLSSMVPGDVLAMMVNDSDSRALFVESGLLNAVISPVKDQLKGVEENGFFSLGFEADGWNDYTQWINECSDEEPGIETKPDDDFNIVYSSGTTGVPKGIVHTNHCRYLFAMGLGLGFRIHSYARTILTTPLYTNGTWMTLLPTLLLGGTVVIMPSFDPKLFMELVQKERCTHTFMVPTQFIVIMAHPDFEKYDLSSMEMMISAAAPLRENTKREIIQKFGSRLAELYGLTEGFGTVLNPEEMEGKTGSVGKPLTGGDMRIIDQNDQELPWGEVGEIVGYQTGLMRGYYKQPEKTAECIWKDEHGRTFLKTGDVGRIDENGFLYILDRKKDMIVSGGINIFASDIEEIIAKHPDVMDVAVIATPHEKWGESPVALIIGKQGATASEDEIKEWANKQLAKYQRLTLVEFRNEFPRNALGKVLKRQLREPYWNE